MRTLTPTLRDVGLIKCHLEEVSPLYPAPVCSDTVISLTKSTAATVREPMLRASASCTVLLPAHSLPGAWDPSSREMACWNHLGSSLWAKKLLQKGNFSIWPQCRLSSVEARQLLGEWPAGKGGLQRIHLESSSRSLVPTTHSWCAAASEMVSVAVRAADPLCSVSLTQTLRLPDSLLMERGKHLLNHKLHIPCLISSLPQPAGGHPDLHQVPTVRP